MEFKEDHRNGLYEFTVSRRRPKWPIWIVLILGPLAFTYPNFIIIIIMALFHIAKFVCSESVILLPGLGIQMSQQRLLSTCTHFIPIQEIENILIIEGIRLFQVRFYLGLLIRDSGKVRVLFEEFLPRLHILERVYAYSNKMLSNNIS